MSNNHFSKSIKKIMLETYISFLSEERVNDEKFIDYMNSMIIDIKNDVSTIQPIEVSDDIYAWIVYDDIKLFIVNKPSEKFSGRYSPGKDKKDKKLILNVANSPYETYFSKKDWAGIIDGMKDVLFHELTHYMDFNRIETHDDYVSPREKSSLEFNAVFNSVFHHFYKKADDIAKSKDTDKLALFHKEFGNSPTAFMGRVMNPLMSNKVITDEYPTVDQWHWKKRIFDTYRILRDRIFNTIIAKESVYRV